MHFRDIHPVDRPREKLIKLGSKRLKKEELLAILINTGIPGKNVLEIATDIFKKNSLAEFLDLDYKQLLKLPGINEAKACSILATKELMTRYQNFYKKSVQINDSKTATIYFEELRPLKKEHLMVLYLNIHNEVIWKETITMGTIDSTAIHPREVFEPAIRYLASSIVLAHNHPSGDTQPSSNDLEITEQIIRAGKILGIDVLDHLIIGKDNYFSFKDSSLM